MRIQESICLMLKKLHFKLFLALYFTTIRVSRLGRGLHRHNTKNTNILFSFLTSINLPKSTWTCSSKIVDACLSRLTLDSRRLSLGNGMSDLPHCPPGGGNILSNSVTALVGGRGLERIGLPRRTPTLTWV